jgi:hypothetical protein
MLPKKPNPRRAYDADGNEIPPMSLGNMREHGVRSVLAICQESAILSLEGLPARASVQCRSVLWRWCRLHLRFIVRAADLGLLSHA